LRLARFLEQGGARVILTREEDRDLADPGTVRGRKRQDLERRVALANRDKADVFVSIHVNSFEEADEHGAQTFYQPECAGGRELAQAIQTEFKALLGNTDRQPKPGDYFIGRKTVMPTAVVEVGFLTNPQEFELLQEPAYQSKIAFAIYAGIVRYFAAFYDPSLPPATTGWRNSPEPRFDQQPRLRKNGERGAQNLPSCHLSVELFGPEVVHVVLINQGIESAGINENQRRISLKTASASSEVLPPSGPAADIAFHLLLTFRSRRRP